MCSSESEDELISYGTPLEPLEEDEIPKKKPCLLEDQVVKDKQGRRRFHGAFTGGFSAGFYNTVGSLEGWIPSAFKSSKNNKQEILHQTPEDFMDEEDVSEFGICPVVLKAKRDYVAGNKRKLTDFSEVSILGKYVLKNILQPVRETVGIKLLKKMGWKPGEGVGPKPGKNEERSLKIRKKKYGCQLPPGILEEYKAGISDSDSDSELEDMKFAFNSSEPYMSYLSQFKINFCGIGYKGLDKRPILGSSTRVFDSEEKNKNVRYGSQAFGVGVFEEEDEDIYSKDDMSRYDFCLGTNQATTDDPVEKASLKFDNILDGFIEGKKETDKKYYKLPLLPRDFKPHHKIHKSRFDQMTSHNETVFKTHLKTSKMNSEERRSLIAQMSEDTQMQEDEITKKLIRNVEINIASFKPFSLNPEKQERYENYLKLIKIGRTERLSFLQPSKMSEWDKQRERIEFEKAALLFKPLTGVMEERFLSASQPDDLSNPLAAVEKFKHENDEREKAAKLNFFGPLTRKTEDWTPCQLLCKRFNIPEPKKSYTQVTDKKVDQKHFCLFETGKEEKENPDVYIASASSFPDRMNNDFGIAEINEKNLDELQDKIDIFKAIFLASDEEDEKEIREERHDIHAQVTKSEELPNQELLFEEKVINSKRNLSPPGGIFENIKLESFTMRKQSTHQRKDVLFTEIEYAEAEKSEKDNLCSNLMYGPKLPQKITKLFTITTEHGTGEDLWVEKKTNKKQKKYKKTKKSSKKSKQKHKKHRR